MRIAGQLLTPESRQSDRRLSAFIGGCLTVFGVQGSGFRVVSLRLSAANKAGYDVSIHDLRFTANPVDSLITAHRSPLTAYPSLLTAYCVIPGMTRGVPLTSTVLFTGTLALIMLSAKQPRFALRMSLFTRS